jgi:hypothetical protein
MGLRRSQVYYCAATSYSLQTNKRANQPNLKNPAFPLYIISSSHPPTPVVRLPADAAARGARQSANLVNATAKARNAREVSAVQIKM